MEPSHSQSETPLLSSKESRFSRFKPIWRFFLIANLAIGAYTFANPRKKDTSIKREEHSKTETEAAGSQKEPPILPVVTKPALDPIPEDQQRELFKWILEEKRKAKPNDPEEKKRIDKEKAVLKHPLTSLCDNLIITLQDDEGNEISHTGVETRLVVEKGVWDDIFSLEGGGHVHMKLQFVLSEEEHRRIRIMRETALKKKHEELCDSDHGSPKSSSVCYSEVSGSPESSFQSGLLAGEASPVSLLSNNLEDAKFGVDDRNRSYPIQKQRNTDSVSPELEKANTSKKQGPAVKAHSNIRKMISAFEGGLNQDVKSSTKPPPTISRTRETPVDSHVNDVKTEQVISPKDVKSSTKPPPTISQTRETPVDSLVNDVKTEQVISPKVDADAGTAAVANEDEKTFQKLRPRSKNSEDPQDSVGPLGQVIKVVIMVGFATLVLLTRKRTYR